MTSATPSSSKSSTLRTFAGARALLMKTTGSGDQRTATRFSSDRHDLDDVVFDLRDLELEQPLHEPFGRSREDDERSFVGLAHVEDVGTDAIVDPVVFPRDLFRERQERLVLVVEQDVHVAMLVR